MRFFVNPFADYVVGESAQQQVEKWTVLVPRFVSTIVEKMPPTLQNCDGGLYVGVAGVAYMFYKLSRMEQFATHRQEFLQNAADYIAVAIQYVEKTRSRDPPSSFILGAAGVYMVGSLVASEMGDQTHCKRYQKKYSELAKTCVPVNFLQCGSDELFVGRSGYLLGAFLLNKQFDMEVVSKTEIFAICDSIMQSGRSYSSRREKLPCPLMYSYYNTEYIGAAHGVSAILMILLFAQDYVKSDPGIENDIKSSIDFVLSLKQENGNYPPDLDEAGKNRRPESEELVHWCHGAPGVVYMFAKAYLFWKDEKYLQACIECGEVTWQKGLLKKGPGICHGVAGSGYVHLLLHRLTGDAKYLYRAEKFAEFLLSKEFKQARNPDSPYSLYEGLAGTVCFLADLLNPSQAAFPLFDVFL